MWEKYVLSIEPHEKICIFPSKIGKEEHVILCVQYANRQMELFYVLNRTNTFQSLKVLPLLDFKADTKIVQFKVHRIHGGIMCIFLIQFKEYKIVRVLQLGSSGYTWVKNMELRISHPIYFGNAFTHDVAELKIVTLQPVSHSRPCDLVQNWVSLPLHYKDSVTKNKG